MTTEKEIEDGKRALQFLDMQGYRRCNIGACNCPYWHGGNAGDRLQEIHEVLSDAGLEPHRKTAIKAIERLIEVNSVLKEALEEMLACPDFVDGLQAKYKARKAIAKARGE